MKTQHRQINMQLSMLRTKPQFASVNPVKPDKDKSANHTNKIIDVIMCTSVDAEDRTEDAS